MNKLRVACSPLTGTIYAGRPNKAGTAWAGEKHDVTSDVIGAVIQKVGPGNIITVHENGQPAYEIEVRALAASHDTKPAPLTRCAAGRDGECGHAQCPQLRDGEPHATGRHCPLDHDTGGKDE